MRPCFTQRKNDLPPKVCGIPDLKVTGSEVRQLVGGRRFKKRDLNQFGQTLLRLEGGRKDLILAFEIFHADAQYLMPSHET